VALLTVEDLTPFITEDVGVTIYDETWTTQSPLREEKISHVTLCPNQTHLRIYFNEMNFFAIPREAKMTTTKNTWTAYDEQSRLHYVIERSNDD